MTHHINCHCEDSAEGGRRSNLLIKRLLRFARNDSVKVFIGFVSVIIGLVLNGCTVHQFQKSAKHGGYVVARFAYVIPEYTVDLENKAPSDFNLAKSRYLRRNDMVETYYFRMGQIENYGRRYITHFPRIMWSIFANTVKMPLHIFSEYKYDHNEKYRQRIDALDAQRLSKEDQKINRIKEELKDYLVKDLEKESSL